MYVKKILILFFAVTIFTLIGCYYSEHTVENESLSKQNEDTELLHAIQSINIKTDNNSEKTTDSNILKELGLEDRYKITQDLSKLKKENGVVTGRLDIKGDLTPAVVLSFSKKDRADPRKVSRAFIEQENELFGVEKGSDLRVVDMRSSYWDQSTNITFEHYIEGVRVDNKYIRVRMNTVSNNIDSLEAELVKLSE